VKRPGFDPRIEFPGITVNVVALGYIETDITERISEKTRPKMLEVIPMGRC
jgi:NAD(P)-dependent dehydrogenase (short-subunit alcohol dehydrogenase family)